MTRLELARQYCKEFEGFGKKSIARKLFKDHPEIFTNVEDARTTIRYIKGATGEQLRNSVSDKSDFEDRAKILMGIFDDWDPGSLNDFIPYAIPKNIEKIGYIADLHMPYHNKGAIMVSLEYLDKKGIKALVINGDGIDCYSLSKFQKDPTARRFKEELDVTRDFLARLRTWFPDTLIVYKTGNHEDRFEAILKVKAPEFYDIKEVQLDQLLRLRELNIEFVDKKKIIQAGHLNVLHGHEFGMMFNNPVSPARGALLKANENILVAHHHKISKQPGKSLNGKSIAGWSMGALCDMHPEYRPINDWALGFGVQTIIDDAGNFRFDNKEILVDGNKNENFKFTIV